MANPRVFISSTCYDLGQVRDSLVDFILSYGFEPVLSDRGDVFYHPDIHTHDSCLNEVGNCQLCILIIGGRFGGTYKVDPTKSIVNAEYIAARDNKIPLFTFVKSNIHHDRHVFSKNKDRKGAVKIVYPSIDDNSHAEQIFSFIDDVNRAPTNNGIFPFDFARDIASILRKQWAGMIFDFLDRRKTENQLAVATDLLQHISVAGEKVEELVKALYRHIDKAAADKSISSVEKLSMAREFYNEAIRNVLSFSTSYRTTEQVEELKNRLISTPREGEWYEYFANATGGTFSRTPEGLKITLPRLVMTWHETGPLSALKRSAAQFDVVKTLSADELRTVVDDVTNKLAAAESPVRGVSETSKSQRRKKRKPRS